MLTYGEYCNLVDELVELAKAYSNGNSPVEDVVYDTKYKQLKEFELSNPDLVLPESPTQNVIEEHTDGFKKVEHDSENPMVSITNANGIEEAVAWVAEMKEKYGVTEIELEYKIDGAALELRYDGSLLDDAVTRGQNNIGDSIIANATAINGVQTKIDQDDYTEIRGEVVWPFDAFDEFNERLEDEGKKPMANPRNGAAGSIKLTNPKEVAVRKLSYIAYIVAKGSKFGKHSEDVTWLESLGFEVPPYHVVNIAVDGGLERFRVVAETMREKRGELAYPIDGIVLKVNDKSLYDKIGRTNKAPNFYKAYKFPPEEKETLLLDIEESVGMSGAITPVAIVQPVSLAMTTVSRCSLHNWDIVDWLGLHKGCHVVLRKAGEIIPELVKCSETNQSKDDYDIQSKKKRFKLVPWSKTHVDPNIKYYERPEECPFCHSPLEHASEDAVAWVCPNPCCEAQIVGKLCKFVARNVMAIRGIGESIIQNLYDAGRIKNAADLYDLTQKDFIDYCGCREKKADKLLAAIEKSKGNYLNQLLEGLGIPGVGHVAAMALANAIHDCGGFAAMLSGEQQMKDTYLSNGVSDTMWLTFGLYVNRNKDMLRRLVDKGVALTVNRKAATSTKLEGKVCIMTGTFDKLARDDFKNLVESNGGKICSSITKQCNIVLMGDNAGPAKIQKIEKLKAAGQQIAVYTPETLNEFLTLLQ